jgi:PAS domain-containing protein
MVNGGISPRAIPLLNVDGSLREWVGVHTDITERKQQQQILAESEYRYHNIIPPPLIAILKEDMIIEIANDAIIKTWGKEKISLENHSYHCQKIIEQVLLKS